MKYPITLLNYIRSLPHLPGVYRMLNVAGEVLYVGKAIDLRKRVSSYFQKTVHTPRIAIMVSQVHQIEITVTRSEEAALILENNLIKALKPRYNILFRDDKSYPYIVLTSHDFPKLQYYRGSLNKKNSYFGPYPNAVAVKQNIEMLQKTFLLRTCTDSVFKHRSRPCLLYQIKRCSAPCVARISQEKYAESVADATVFMRGMAKELTKNLNIRMKEASAAWKFEEAAQYRDQLAALNKLRERQYINTQETDMEVDVVAAASDQGIVCINLVMIRGGQQVGDKSFFPLQAQNEDLSTVTKAFLMQHYLERAVPSRIICSHAIADPTLVKALSEQKKQKVAIQTYCTGVKRVWLNMAQKNALLAIAVQAGQQQTQIERYQQLAQLLKLPVENGRIECFDISHSLGEATVASCIVYEKYSLQPREYRRFNISGITPGDDYAAMRQALIRRYTKVQAEKIPDLVLIDGGKGQFKVAQMVFEELGINQTRLVAVAKGEMRKPGLESLILAKDQDPLHLPANSPALHLIQMIRDEAHRFAIMGHRARRVKVRTRSIIENISGIGAKRRKKLLTHFGGLHNLSHASIEELRKVDGIGPDLAIKIYETLHE